MPDAGSAVADLPNGGFLHTSTNQGREERITASPPIEPILMGMANGGCGASSPIRGVVSHRQQSADSRPSHLAAERGASTSKSHLRPRRGMIVSSGRRYSHLPSKDMATGSRQLVEQHLSLFQIRRVEPFGELAVDRREKVAGFGAAILIAPQPGEAHGSA